MILCTCETKTPELKYHAANCAYRIYMELRAERDGLENELAHQAEHHHNLMEEYGAVKSSYSKIRKASERVIMALAEVDNGQCMVRADHLRRLEAAVYEKSTDTTKEDK